MRPRWTRFAGRAGRRERHDKVSIIVVTYNNLDYTRLTLQSVLAKTAYPAFEIVVVDNGSDAAMRDWLTRAAAAEPRLRVIFNERNLGFPAANNIGIRACPESDYIVLLNNDCIVTPGWLTRLLRYLRDPRIGMVGPVTNFAGNEACITPSYTRLEDLDRFARVHTSAHRGQSFDIPMLAMFCLAMRRAVVDQIGPLDEQFGAGMFEDDDYVQRVRQAGYRIVCAEDAYVHHFGRSSFGKLDDAVFTRTFQENRARFEAKWRAAWEPPRARPGVIVEPWAEHVARHQRAHGDPSRVPEPAKANRPLAALGAAIGAPLRLAHAAYHAAIPYERRIVLWSWRRRQTFQLRQLAWGLNPRLVRQCRAELRAILAAHPEAERVIIFPPSIPWNIALFQRPQQMALAFAQRGCLVLYWVEDIQGQAESVHFQNIAGRLYLCRVPPAALRVCDRPVFISYTYNSRWATLLRAPLVVYELIDHLDIFSDYPARMLQRHHQRLLRRARVVVGTADELVAELKKDRPDAVLCPNGVDLAHFAPPESEPAGAGQDIPDDLRPIRARGKPIIGYYGAMAEWFDFELVKHAAEALPDYEFVLIGPDYDGRTMAKANIAAHPTIHWLGPKKYAELPRYLAAFDVATIPFTVSDALNAVSPIKLFEYMAGGKPIVTTDLVECRKYPVVLTARDHAEWVGRLREAVALRHDAAYLAQLRATAEANTWQARAETILAALDTRITAPAGPHHLVARPASRRP